MSFVLSDIEANAVHRALQAYLPELRYEAARMKRQGDRLELIELEEILTQLSLRLEGEPVGETAARGI
jgi:hypothetical protein